MAKGFELTPGERKAFLLILVFCVVGTILTARKTSQQSRPRSVVTLRVQVDGAVLNPGIYQLPEGARVEDAIKYAGGLRADADTSKLNMVAKLKDGQRITVPTIHIVQPQVSQPFPSYGANYSPMTGKIDLNTATPEELASLPGIGPSLANKIVQYRQAVGRFNYVEELLNVPGIGEKKFQRIKQYVEVR